MHAHGPAFATRNGRALATRKTLSALALGGQQRCPCGWAARTP